MTRLRAALGSFAFLVLVPGVIAGLLPWALTDWEPSARLPLLQVTGAVLLAAGVGVLLHAFVRFVVEGLGTPAPIAPTEHLVVGGLYRHVRNPMYLAVDAMLIGQALILGRLDLVLYGALFTATVVAFVRGYEEPTLRTRHGAAYAAYCRAVPGWLPRVRPWNGEEDD